MQYTFYTSDQVKERILSCLQELEQKKRTQHPNSFFAKTYPARKARYFELLNKIEQGEQLSSFVMIKLFHKGARHAID
jgi:hypothetical protein